MNQTKGYWLLFNVLFVNFSICGRLCKEYKTWTSINPPLISGNLKLGWKTFMLEWGWSDRCVGPFFFAFVVNFNFTIAHNMCVLQPNPCFKGL